MNAGPPDDVAELSVPDLMGEASARAGVAGGDSPFTANLGRLVDACRRSRSPSPLGWAVLRKVALRHLRNLLELDAHLAGHPEERERPLGAPVVVTGLPRTGTTLLHNLLSLDPAHRVLRFWQALRPVPTASVGASPEQLRAQAARWLQEFYRLVPDFRAIHPATPDGPEECDALLQNTFASQHFDDMFDADDYSAWLATAGLAAEYEHYALQLRTLSGPSADGPTWALKSPSHLGHLDSLLAVLPGATVVVCHRDPREAVASYASLIHALRATYCVAAEPGTIGQQALHRASTAMERALQARAVHGEHAFVDVPYAVLERDPVGATCQVYERMGKPMMATLERGLRQWANEHPRHRHGPHRYDLERFGLGEAEVLGRFGAYLDRFASALN